MRPCPAPRCPRLGGTVGRDVAVDDVERLGDRVDELDRPCRDAPVRVAPDRVGQPDPVERGARLRVELVACQRDPGRRAEQVRDPVAHVRLEGMRPGHLFLVEGRLPVGRREVQPVRRDDPPVVHRVLGRVPQGDECAPRDRTPARRRSRPSRRSRGPARGRPRGPARSTWSSRFVGTFEKPPTRTLTGWMGRPPRIATIRLPAFLSISPRSTAARSRAASSTALAHRGSRARGAGRRGGRDSRSTRRSTAGVGAPAPTGR